MQVETRTPTLSKGVEVGGSEDHRTLTRRKFGPFRTLLLRVFRIAPDFTLKLDPLGSHVVNLIDGQRDVQRILQELQAQLPEEEQLPQRLGVFLSALVRNRLVELRA